MTILFEDLSSSDLAATSVSYSSSRETRIGLHTFSLPFY